MYSSLERHSRSVNYSEYLYCLGVHQFTWLLSPGTSSPFKPRNYAAGECPFIGHCGLSLDPALHPYQGKPNVPCWHTRAAQIAEIGASRTAACPRNGLLSYDVVKGRSRRTPVVSSSASQSQIYPKATSAFTTFRPFVRPSIIYS